MTGIVLPIFFLSVFGFFNLLGISQTSAFSQLFNYAFAFAGYFVIKKIGRNFFRDNASVFYWLSFFLLLATFILGIEVKGSKRWIDLYFFNFQASEFFKISLTIYLADIFSRIKKGEELTVLLRSIFFVMVPAFIVFKQPDLGNAIILVSIYLTILIFSSVPKKYLFYLLIAAIIIIPIGWFTLHDYQRQRLTSFVSPHLDTRGTAYNMVQAVITIGSGRFLGRGLGLGTQSRLFFLPENQTDFAYASLVEQFGFVGGMIVLILYLVIAIHLLRLIVDNYYQNQVVNRFNYFYSLGLSAYLFYQVFINIAMNLGIFPIAGVALPFISYGGSAPVSLMLGFALLP